MEIAMEFSIIKVNSHSVVRFLVHCPDSTGQVKAYISLKISSQPKIKRSYLTEIPPVASP